MRSVLISEFKTHCVGLLHEVQASQQDLLVTKRGRPVVRVVPEQVLGAGARIPGDASESARILGEIVETDTSDVWENL